MDFWDLLKKHYDTGRPAPQGKDWEAMEQLIQAQPELQPSSTSPRWA